MGNARMSFKPQTVIDGNPELPDGTRLRSAGYDADRDEFFVLVKHPEIENGDDFELGKGGERVEIGDRTGGGESGGEFEFACVHGVKWADECKADAHGGACRREAGDLCDHAVALHDDCPKCDKA